MFTDLKEIIEYTKELKATKFNKVFKIMLSMMGSICIMISMRLTNNISLNIRDFQSIHTSSS